MITDPSGAAVVTGASRGIGRATAIELAARGFDVIATMRDVTAGASLADEAAARGGKLRVEYLDVTKPETIVLPDDLRVLVNNAGVQAPYLPLEETPLDLMREMFDTNVYGQLEVLKKAIPIMRGRGEGVLCNVTSSSILTPVPFFSMYRGAKAALSAITETLRVELAPFGIRMVEILPGPIDTDMLRNSNRLPAAGAFEPYREVAEEMYAGRAHIDTLKASTEVAGAMIADAILEADGPMRYGCDPMSVDLLERWRHVSDEEIVAPMLARYAPAPS